MSLPTGPERRTVMRRPAALRRRDEELTEDVAPEPRQGRRAPFQGLRSILTGGLGALVLAALGLAAGAAGVPVEYVDAVAPWAALVAVGGLASHRGADLGPAIQAVAQAMSARRGP